MINDDTTDIAEEIYLELRAQGQTSRDLRASLHNGVNAGLRYRARRDGFRIRTQTYISGVMKQKISRQDGPYFRSWTLVAVADITPKKS